MKHSLEEVVRWQYSEVTQAFDAKGELEELEGEVNLPVSERELERSDIEIVDDIDKQKIELAKHENNYKTPISLTECVLPQMARVRVKESSKKHYRESLSENELKWGFFLLGEVMQASGHIVVVSDFSGRVIGMLHSEDFEVVSTQEC